MHAECASHRACCGCTNSLVLFVYIVGWRKGPICDGGKGKICMRDSHILISPFCTNLPVASPQTGGAVQQGPCVAAGASPVNSDSRRSRLMRATNRDGMPRSASSQTPMCTRSWRAVSCSRRDKPISSHHRAAELLIHASCFRVVWSRVRYKALDSISPACTPPPMPASVRW